MAVMTTDLLAGLNPEQQQAVQHFTGPALVLAGAGSGKTKVLTTRAAWLIQQHHVAPEQILLVTFTNKAAQEMNSRVERLTGSRLPFSGTFHSLCAKILRREAHHVGLDHNFVIYDADDQLALLKQLYKQFGYSVKDINPNGVKAEISKAKNNMIDPQAYQQAASGQYQEKVGQLYQSYNQKLRKNQAVDFDDLMVLVVKLLQMVPDIRAKYQRQFEFVMVDEYQDTNTVQYQLTKLLTAPQNNLFVVGDFAQSIYAWRGADYKNMSMLSQDFPEIKTYRLEQNYRSTQSILDAATNVISRTDAHPILNLWTENTKSNPLYLIEASSSDEEAQIVLQRVTKQLASDYSYNDIAILYRTNAQSRSFEEACIRYGIPYRLVGGFKFYERKEIKDVLAYLRLALNPDDSVSFQRAEKLGKTVFKKFLDWRANQPTLPSNPHELLTQVLTISRYKEKFDLNDAEDATRLENIEELLNVASQFQEVATFLENIALVQDNAMADVPEEKESRPALTLMSLHSAKGLEFPVVFMVGMEEGLLPHSRSLFSKDEMEEERRLCYVGITRAKEQLIFTHARQRWQYGSSSSSVRSRFIQDIPSELIEATTTNTWTEPSYSRYQSNGYGTNGYQNQYQRRSSPWDSQPKPKATRRIVIDDDQLDAVLDGDIDLDAFLNS
jgi:DNA helicase II / ATP-dependent DNA helicase PcrA